MPKYDRYDRTNVKRWYVYALFRQSGEPFYVGMGAGPRWLIHELDAVRLRAAGKRRSHKDNIILAMIDAGTPVPKVKVKEGLTRDEAIDLEISLIASLGRWPDGPLTNLTAGGEGLWDPSGETAAKIGAAHKGKKWKLGYKLTEEQRARCSAGQTGLSRPYAAVNAALARISSPANKPGWVPAHRIGVKDSPEVVEKRRQSVIAALSANPLAWITDGRENLRVKASDPIPDGWHRGRVFDEEAKANIIAASTGPRSEEVRANIKAGHAGIWDDSAKREAMMKNRRPFSWFTDGKTSKKVHADEVPPVGWRLGRTIDAQKLVASRDPGKPRKARNPELEPAKIMARLAAGETISGIARALGVDPSSVHDSANRGGRVVTPRAAKPEAEHVDRRPEAAKALLANGEASRRGSKAWAPGSESREALMASRRDKIWITDGTNNISQSQSAPIPEGWRRGRVGLYGRAAAKAKKETDDTLRPVPL